MANPTGKGGFAKGDPRINRKGRPQSFDALRSLAREIGHEAAKSGGQPLEIDGHLVTVTEAILRQWASSKDPRLQMAFIEIAYGKVPQRTEVTGADGGPQKHEVTITDDAILRKLLPELASGNASDAPVPAE